LSLIRFLSLVLVITVAVSLFAYPPLLEGSDGECSALEHRVADLASSDGAGLLTIHALYGSTSSEPSGAAYVRDRYPLLPPSLGCAVAYWKTVIDPWPSPSPDAPSAPGSEPAALAAAKRESDRFESIIARDITPNGDPISPAAVFTLPMDAVAIRVDDPGARASTARFQVLQGKTVLSSCNAERGTPGVAWCKFNVSLRKGNYSIALTENNVRLGQFPFTVIGR